MFTFHQLIGFRARIILTSLLIFMILSCSGCATIAALNWDDVVEAATITQPFALTHGK
jgi:hypothetical protein